MWKLFCITARTRCLFHPPDAHHVDHHLIVASRPNTCSGTSGKVGCRRMHYHLCKHRFRCNDPYRGTVSCILAAKFALLCMSPPRSSFVCSHCVAFARAGELRASLISLGYQEGFFYRLVANGRKNAHLHTRRVEYTTPNWKPSPMCESCW